MPEAEFPFNIMVFPGGPICNLDCDYCYYLDKTSLYPQTDNFQMTEQLLEEFIKQYIEAQPGPVVQFGWQGGEPTLRGLDFFRQAVELEEKYLPVDWEYQNSFQTNGVLLTDEWCQFLSDNNFLVGISIDGPANLHDPYRKDKKGEPSHEKVLRGLHLLQKHNVEYNVLCVVNDLNVKYPHQVYNFFKGEGIEHVQFIPIVEHLGNGKVSERTVRPEEYGRFLISVFDEWVYNDLGDIYVQIFEECVTAWAGYGASLCVFSETCGRAAVMEHNGDIYSCDHFVFPENKLGNIRNKHLAELITSDQQQQFGQSKQEKLPETCQHCDVRFICNGGCLRNRIIDSGEEGKPLNYLCAGYKQFFNYIDPYLQDIANSVKKRRAPSLIKKQQQLIHDSIWNKVGRNDPCPCGSGRKFKKCCLARK